MRNKVNMSVIFPLYWILLLLLFGTINGEIPSLTPPYSTVTINEKESFNYTFEGDEIIFLLETTMEGYAAIGFGTEMNGSDIIIV